MIDNTYNKGFGYEKAVIIYCNTPNGKKGFELWEGYFDNILRGCYNSKIVKGGLLYGYMTQTEWCDESPWKIEDTSTALTEISMFSEKAIPEMATVIEKLKEIQLKLINLMQCALQSRLDIFIEYD